MAKEEHCSNCEYLVDYLDEDKWGEVCGKCGKPMSRMVDFISYEEYLKSLKK